MKKKFGLISLFWFGLAATSVAQPVIDAFIGEFKSESKISIRGSSFGNPDKIAVGSGPVDKNDLMANVVLLGDHRSYDDCEDLFKLGATAWSDSSIVLDLEITGVFASKEVYLFVLDYLGRPSRGMGPLIYGEGLVAIPPGQPGKPRQD